MENLPMDDIRVYACIVAPRETRLDYLPQDFVGWCMRGAVEYSELRSLEPRLMTHRTGRTLLENRL